MSDIFSGSLDPSYTGDYVDPSSWDNSFNFSAGQGGSTGYGGLQTLSPVGGTVTAAPFNWNSLFSGLTNFATGVTNVSTVAQLQSIQQQAYLNQQRLAAQQGIFAPGGLTPSGIVAPQTAGSGLMVPLVIGAILLVVVMGGNKSNSSGK